MRCALTVPFKVISYLPLFEPPEMIVGFEATPVVRVGAANTSGVTKLKVEPNLVSVDEVTSILK